MKIAIVLCALCALTGCPLTPKQWAYVGAGVLVTGYLASVELNNGNHHCPNCDRHYTINDPPRAP